MLVTKKQKKVLRISLIVSMIVAILIAMSVGIYFIVKSGKSQLLSKDQQMFGQAFSSLSNDPQEEVVDTSRLPSDMNPADLVFVTEEYFVSCNNSNEYKIYSLGKSKYVNVMFDFEKIESICGNIAVVSGRSGRSLIDLSEGTYLGSINNAKIQFSGGFALIESVDRGKVEFLKDTKTSETTALVVDTYTLDCLYSVSRLDDVIRLELTKNYIFAYFGDRTEVVSLKDTSIVKVFQNTTTTAPAGEGFASEYNTKSYDFSDFTRLSDLGSGAILLERAIADVNDFDLSLGAQNKYRLEYKVLNLESGAIYDIDNEGCVLSREESGANGYIAIVFSKIEDKTTISESQKTIKYYQFDTSKAGGLKEIVKYDYVKNGKVAGFNGKNLIVSGGALSGELDFSGNNTEMFKTDNNQKISFSNDVYVITSIIGEKTIYKKDGTRLFDKTFLMVSPFFNGNALAYDGESYYILNLNAEEGESMRKIKLSSQSVDYAFMGTGLYFVDGKNGVDVVRLGGERIYADASVDFTLLSQNSLLLKVTEGETSHVHKITTQRAFVKIGDSVATSLSEQSPEKVREFSAPVKGVLESNHTLEQTKEMVVDEVSGVGKMTYGFDYDMNDLTFRQYEDLTGDEKLMIPTFDQETSSAHNYVDSVNEKTYMFIGAHFLTNTNIAVAILKLNCDGKFFYVICVTMREMYISKITATSTISGVVSRMKGSDGPAPFDYSNAVIMPPNRGLVLFSELDNSKIRYPSFTSLGYDGGIVLSSAEAQSLQFEIEVRNTYYASGLSSDYIDYTDSGTSRPTQTFNYTGYTLTVDYANKTALIKATNGLFITGFSLAYATRTEAVYAEYEDKSETEFEVVLSEVSIDLDANETIFRLKNVSLTELYHKISLVNEEDEVLGEVYYFNGYTAARNPAPLGFKDFYRRTNIDIPEKPGYTFAGYTYGEDEAIDASGAYVYRGTFVKETTGVDVFKFVAKFEPNKYRIYFDVLNETLATDGLEVTFQSPIGEGLLTYDDIVALTEESPVLYNLVLGNEFDGWYTLPNGEGELYTSETIYNVVGNTTLYAKMIPRTYEITLHSNVESYANQIVDGFTYNIGEATLKEDYMSHSAGSVFTTTTIEVTFGSTYGVLPVLEGHSTDESKTGERYKFVGWFDQQTFMYLDGGEFSRGEQIDENTEVSNSPIKDLYAHYVREIYQVDLSVNNDAIAHAGDQDIEVLSELQYTGSTSDGKAITKDINLEGDNAWINQDGIYNAYTLQNEDINFAVKVNWGYYIRAIRVSVYPLGDTPASYTLTYTWDSATDSSSADSVLDNEYVQVTNGEETGIILKKVNSQTERGLYATIDIDVGVMHHNSVFNFVSDVDFHFSSVDELEVESDGRLFTFSNIGYGSTHEFKIDFLDREDIANAFIKSISVDGKIITFEQLYMLDDEGIYHLVLVGSEEAEESTEGDILERKYSLARDEFDSVEFICHTSISTGVTTYSVVICQTKSFRVDIEVEAINANVSVDPHAGRETAENGLDITASMNDEPVSDFNIEMSATDVVIYRIRAKEGMFISALNMKIGEENYSLFRTTLAEQDGNIVTQSTNVAVDTWFIVRSGVVYLNGTGVYISFSAASQTYTIYITNLAMDISFDVYYFSMTAISVKGGEGDVDYDFVVTRGLDSLIGTDLKETATEVDSGTVFASNNVYKVGNIYCFVGYKDSVKEIKLTLKFVGELAYKVTRTESSPVGYCSAEANNREVTINMMTNTAVITVERFSGRLTNFSSYLGVGGEEYEKDPFANRPLLSNINIIYQNSELAETTYILTRNFSAIGFVNNKLKVKVYKIKGYNYTTSKLIAGSEEIEPTLSEGEDDGGSYTLLEFVISDFSVTNFEIEVYQKAVEFDISYDPSNDSTHSATGSMANTHHVYNVESRLSEGGYEREFYTLIGYSLSPVSGADLTSEDCDFVVNENLTIDKYALFDLGDENGDIVVKLYLVFEANKYNVRPILNDSTMGSGSTVSSVPAEIEEVATDHALTGLGDLRRDGYTFLGWFTANTSSARKIEDGQVVDASFLRSVNIQNGAIEIHARWQANTYTIVVHKNDASDGGYGSTTATGTAGEHSVVFDQPFSKFASLSRVGYDYLGYKAVRLSSAQSLTDNHSYIGDGENCKLVLDGSYASLGITLNDETKVVDIYAVYTAQTFRAYVNLNNRSLATYNQPDGMTTVLYNGRSVKTNVDYVDMYLEVLFDSAFGTLP